MTNAQTLGREVDLAAANEALGPMSALQRVRWADETFGRGLRALTSGGTQSAVLPRLINRAGLQTGQILIDTGNSFKESIYYAGYNADLNGLPLEVYHSLRGEMEDDEAWEFYRGDPADDKEVTKLEPLRRAISEEGITAIMSGVRAAQNENRAGLDFIGTGKDGEYRIHPILDWSEEDVIRFMWEEGLETHPLAYKLGSIGDRITTVPGRGREGRLIENSECGLHT